MPTGTAPTTESIAIKYAIDVRAMPAPQLQLLERHAGTSRAVWNWGLAAFNAHQQQVWEWLTRHAADTTPDEAAAAAALADPAWRKTARKLLPEHLAKRPNAAVLDKAFTAEARDPESRFAWWSTERHGVSRFAVSTALLALDDAIARFYAGSTTKPAPGRRPRKDGRPAGWPRFKRKGHALDAFAIYNLSYGAGPWKIIDDGHRLRVPNLGSLRVLDNTKRLRRAIARGAVPKSARIVRHARRWYITIVATIPARSTVSPNRHQRASGTVGVDVGVHHLAALSTGTTIANPRGARRIARRADRLQRHLARQQGPRPGQAPSRSWIDTKQRLGQLQHTTALRRASTIHELTKMLATTAQTVAIEDLNVRGMTARATPIPDPDQDGAFLPNRRRAKAGLNRSILDAGFGEFRRQLTYKTTWYGATLHVVDRYLPTSKTCSNPTCRAVKPKLPLKVREYQCEQCGQTSDRDVNAARNIAAAAAPTSTPDGADGKRPAAKRRHPAVGDTVWQASPAPVRDRAARKGPPVLKAS
ncbi:RNA-guided endonuclease InsQ/TnpB family protein [Tsukamurella hominis]|uniref:RNA-guided endonuclease InsQ/TnpB family protein n=1 Tax=Tsukamurella hominis TaxID=1970232 RepID=UPI0039EA89AC